MHGINRKYEQEDLGGGTVGISLSVQGAKSD